MNLNLSDADISSLLKAALGTNKTGINTGLTYTANDVKIEYEDVYDSTLVITSLGEIKAIKPENITPGDFASSHYRTLKVSRVIEDAYGEKVEVQLPRVFNIYNKTNPIEWETCKKYDEGVDGKMKIEGCMAIKVRYGQPFALKNADGTIQTDESTGKPRGVNWDMVYVGSGRDHQTEVRRQARSRLFLTSDGNLPEEEE